MADTQSKEVSAAVPDVRPETPVEPISKPDVVSEKIEAAEPTSVKEESKSEKLVEKNGDSKSGEKSSGRSGFDRNKKGGAQKVWVDYRKNAKNIKTDYSSLPESSDHDEIRKQVEFYFSDSNLAYDDFMRSLVVDDKNGNKAVPIKTIHSFKRMHRFQPFSAVVEALKESTVVDVVGNKQDEIRRKVPFKSPETNNEFEDPTITRSIYAKGFGDEDSTTQFDIESLFAPYGPVNMVRLRRTYPDRLFKGSVFVEFETDDIQKQFLDLEEKPKWQGKVLDIMSKQAYCEMKLADIKAGKIRPSNKFQFKQYANQRHNYNGDNRSGDHRDYNGRGGRGNNRGGSRRDNNRGGDRSNNRDRDDWKSRRDDFQKRDRRDERAQRSARDDNGATTQSGDEVRDPHATGVVKETEGSNSPPSKKRGREDDGEQREQSPKKAKEEESAVAGAAS